MLLHIAPVGAWHEGVDETHYRDPSLDTEGFIHCSTPDQVLIPANERFAGRSDLVLLVIDADALDAPLVFEDCYETGIEFPHIYGPLIRSAVSQVVPFPPNADGTFDLPDTID